MTHNDIKELIKSHGTIGAVHLMARVCREAIGDDTYPWEMAAEDLAYAESCIAKSTTWQIVFDEDIPF